MTLPARPAPVKSKGNAQRKARTAANRRGKAAPVKGRLGFGRLGLAQKGKADAVQKEGRANDKPQSRGHEIAFFHPGNGIRVCSPSGISISNGSPQSTEKRRLCTFPISAPKDASEAVTASRSAPEAKTDKQNGTLSGMFHFAFVSGRVELSLSRALLATSGEAKRNAIDCAYSPQKWCLACPCAFKMHLPQSPKPCACLSRARGSR